MAPAAEGNASTPGGKCPRSAQSDTTVPPERIAAEGECCSNALPTGCAHGHLQPAKEEKTRFVVAFPSDPYHTGMKAMMRTLYVPAFLKAAIVGENNRVNRTAVSHPWTVFSSGNFMVMPHPKRYDFEVFPSDPSVILREQRKVAWIAWWVHPELQTDSEIFNPTNVNDNCMSPERIHHELRRFNSVFSERKPEPQQSRSLKRTSTAQFESEVTEVQQLSTTEERLVSMRRHKSTTSNKKPVLEWEQIGQLETRSGQTYVTSVRDLNKQEHLAELRQLDADIDSHLSKCYGFSDEDLVRVEKLFHWPSSAHFCTLHLHIRFNDPHLDYKSESDRLADVGNDQRDEFELKHIIACLEQEDYSFGIQFPFVFQSGADQVQSWDGCQPDCPSDDWWHQSSACVYGPYSPSDVIHKMTDARNFHSLNDI